MHPALAGVMPQMPLFVQGFGLFAAGSAVIVLALYVAMALIYTRHRAQPEGQP